MFGATVFAFYKLFGIKVDQKNFTVQSQISKYSVLAAV
jgi:hypothetical protein